MVIDTSAILVIVWGEAEVLQYTKALCADSNRLVAAPSMLEASIVCLKRFGEVGLQELDLSPIRRALKSCLSIIAYTIWRARAFAATAKVCMLPI